MTTLVLQTSTPPVQFDIVFFGHVLELRSEYVLNTLLITRPSRFAAFWSHVLEFTCVSSFIRRGRFWVNELYMCSFVHYVSVRAGGRACVRA
jgi:hypothetical protein